MTIDTPVFEVLPPMTLKQQIEGKKPGIPSCNPGAPYLGYYLAVGPVAPPLVESYSNQQTDLNFTGQPGTCSKLYYKLMFQLPKWAWAVHKVDEWIEVSPTHREYYERTIATKEALAGTIKSGLASAASAIADYELVNHDLRRYKEIMNYFSRKNEHALRAMFIDQVDVQTGPSGLIEMAKRWPTIIADFQKLTDKDSDTKKIASRLNISVAEALVLKTKNILYMEWKDLFKTAAVERYERLKGLSGARKKSIHEYREWLKPHIMRFKMMKRGGESSDVRKKMMVKSFADITGQSTYTNYIRIWAFKFLKVPEPQKPSVQSIGKFVIDPYDNYVREHFILNPETGLAKLYPWLLKPVQGHKTMADKLAAEIKGEWGNGEYVPAIAPSELYYVFMDMHIVRLGARLPVGEMEDITFKIKNWTISQNILLLKLLEMRCREIQMEKYIEEMLGIQADDETVIETVKREHPELFGGNEKEKKGYDKLKNEWGSTWKSYTSGVSNVMRSVQTPGSPGKFMFIKPGPYEFDFADRITKQYLIPAGAMLSGIENFLKKAMGVE